MAGENDVGALVVRLQAQNEELIKTLRQSERFLEDYAKDAERSNKSVGKSVDDVNKQMQRGVSDTEKRVKKSTDSMTKAFKSMSTIAGGFIQAQLMMRLAALPSELIHSTKEAVLTYDRIDRRLRFVMKSAEGASRAFGKLSAVSAQYGTDLKASAQFYSSFLAATDATNISLAQSEQLFLGTTQAAVALQMSTDQTKASFRAFQQMASKGRVAAEELRGQLGEALPGALGIAARSMNMPIEQLSKIMERGELLAEDLLPAMGKELQKVFSGAALDASETYLANLNRIENEWFKLLAGFGKDQEGLVTPMLKTISEFISAWNHYNATTGDIANGTVGDFQAMGIAIDRFQEKLDKIGDSPNAFRSLFDAEGAEARHLWEINEAFKELKKEIDDSSFGNINMFRNGLQSIVDAGENISDAERRALSYINDSFSVKIEQNAEMRKLLDKGLKLNEVEKRKLQQLAKELGLWDEIRSVVDEITTQQFDINKFNESLVAFPIHAAAESAGKAMFDQLETEEKLLITKEQIKQVTEDMHDLEVRDFESLRQKREEALTLQKELVRLFTQERNLKKEMDSQDDKNNSFISPRLKNNRFDSILGVEKTPIEEAREEWENLEEEYLKHRERIIKEATNTEEELTKLKKQHTDQRLKYEQALMSATLQTNAQMFGDLSTIIAGFAGEQSSVYKAMFAVSKAFAIADGVLKMHQAMMNAMASGPFPWNLSAMATVAAAGASLMSQITSATASFEGGGFTGRGDRSGGVDGRGGFPAVLHPNEMVTDLTKGRMSGGQQPTINIYTLPGQTAETQTSSDGKTIDITIKRTKQEIAADIRKGSGEINKALSQRDKREGLRKR